MQTSLFRRRLGVRAAFEKLKTQRVRMDRLHGAVPLSREEGEKGRLLSHCRDRSSLLGDIRGIA